MATVGIFFGSDTGNTEHIAKMIQKELGKHLFEIRDIAKSSKEDIASFDLLLLGIPTWYYGEAQCDWDDFFPELENIAIRKITLSISLMLWVHCVTLLSLKVPLLLVTGRPVATTLWLLRRWPTTTILSAWVSMKTVSQS